MTTGSSSVITSNAAVDLNSIVAYFISKYENNLFEQKAHLQEQIKSNNEYLVTSVTREIKEEVKLESYNTRIKLLGISVTAKFDIGQDFKNSKMVNIRIYQANRCEGYVDVTKSVKVSDELHAKYCAVVDTLDTLKTDLCKVIREIENISRKEREVRGALAEKTLRDLGAGELFSDPNICKIIGIPSLGMLDNNKVDGEVVS